ncbi:replicative DNA helicase [Ochrobactrum sp. P20RRXII]|nr:DnaB family ATPase [Ochrobactrum sp. P20RRXII]NIH77447.1 replicative DNA helicase [Ochrobactrum sp. P20RRXII]
MTADVAEVEADLPEAKFEFDEEFQDKIVHTFLTEPKFARQIADVLEPEYFTKESNATLVSLTREYVRTYKSTPDAPVMGTLVVDAFKDGRIRKDLLIDVRNAIATAFKTPVKGAEFIAEKVSTFARDKAVERAIIKSVGLHEKGEYAKIADLMREAINVGNLDDGETYDYFAEVENRTQVRKAIATGAITRDGVSSGVSEIDALLYHYGWGRRELSCLMGPSKSGKSALLGTFAKNASLLGYNVLYVSLEVDKTIISDRIDADLSDTIIRDLHVHADDVAAAIKVAQAKAGRFLMRDFGPGTLKVSMLRTMIEKLIADGVQLDMVVVDYADIMAGEERGASLQDQLRQIYIDLRALAFEFNIAVLTATQTNREGAKQTTARATDVGDDWNKTRTVDVLIGINTTEAERQIGESRLVWLMSRNTASGVSVTIQQERQKMRFLKKVLKVES